MPWHSPVLRLGGFDQVAVSAGDLEVIIKIAFRANPPAHTQNMRGQAFGDEFNVITRSLPQKSAATKQVLYLVSVPGVQSDRLQVEIQPATLSVKTVEIDHGNDYIRKIFVVLAVADQRRVIGIMETQIAIALKCGVFPPNPINSRDKVLETFRRIQIAVFQFVLFRMQIFLASRLEGLVLAQLESGTV